MKVIARGHTQAGSVVEMVDHGETTEVGQRIVSVLMDGHKVTPPCLEGKAQKAFIAACLISETAVEALAKDLWQNEMKVRSYLRPWLSLDQSDALDNAHRQAMLDKAREILETPSITS